MVLNYIWVSFFLIAFVVALIRLIFFGDLEIFPSLFSSTMNMAKTGFEISLGLTGAMVLWLGIMKIGENAGVVSIFYKVVGPLLRKIFPDIPPNHKVFGPMIMNVSANMLGLDNAATPLGLGATEDVGCRTSSPMTARKRINRAVLPRAPLRTAPRPASSRNTREAA